MTEEGSNGTTTRRCGDASDRTNDTHGVVVNTHEQRQGTLPSKQHEQQQHEQRRSFGSSANPRASTAEFIEAYGSSVSSLASRLDALLHSLKHVPTEELRGLVAREQRLFEEFVAERLVEFDNLLCVFPERGVR